MNLKKRLDIYKLSQQNGFNIYYADDEHIILCTYTSFKIRLKREIILNKDLAWFIGFFLAEGTKSANTVGLSNCEIPIIKKCLTIAENELGIPSEIWKVCITTSKDRLIDIEKQKELFNKNKINVTINALSTKDNFDIRINNKILAFLFSQMIENFIEAILSNKDLSIEFLKGYSIGDGSINVRNGCVHSVTITAKPKKHKNILEKAFKTFLNVNPNIRMNREAYEIYYCNVEIMCHFIMNEFFKESTRQWKKLMDAYLNKQHVRSHLKYWNTIETRELSAVEIAKITGNSHWSVRDAMNRDMKIGLVLAKRYKKPKELGPSKRYFYLSNQGKMLLTVINDYRGDWKFEKEKRAYNGRSRT